MRHEPRGKGSSRGHRDVRGCLLDVWIEPALDLKLTVGQPPTASMDLVFVDMPEPFAILGAGLFFRYDVLIDQAGGTIGFNPL